MVKTRLDIAGHRFGRLVAVSPHSQDRFRRWRWVCRCDCGSITIAASNNLRTGNSKSCGCLDAESSGKTGSRHFSSCRGEKHYRWVADRRKVTGRPSSIKRWRQGVLRDSVCFKCGAANQLHAHHADSYSGSPSRRLDPTNGVALCARHHREFHAIYGRDEVRQEQLHEYLGYPPIERTVIDLPLAIPSDEHLRLITEAVVSGDLEKARWYIEREILRIRCNEQAK